MEPPAARALDPPHAFTNVCDACHTTHNALGGTITIAAGNGNLCMSCHAPGGQSPTNIFSSADQPFVWPGLPAGATNSGTSHRWDSGLAGFVKFMGGAPFASSGTVSSAGVFTGAYAKTYTINIMVGGTVGGARFNWTATNPGGGAGTNVLAAANVLLNEGVSAVFSNSTNGIPFQVGDAWQIYVRGDLRMPTNVDVLASMTNGYMMCSSCHDEHSQFFAPFDPNAPAYAGTNTGAGRHFMITANDTEQLCNDCHTPRNVTNSIFGSHPVGVAIVADVNHKVATNLPYEKTTAKIRCETCHRIHHAPASDGALLRMTNDLALCIACHTMADTGSAHFASANAATVWPGGQYGSLLPARTNSARAGTCDSCHFVHGWPDAANPTNHYPKLAVDREENLCYTCHDADGPSNKNVKDDFAKAYRHPVVNADAIRKGGRTAECTDCHNMHMAQIGVHTYSTTATATRNRISASMAGVSGIDVNFTGQTNWATITSNLYYAIPKFPGATNEYQICFKCHAAYAWLSSSAPTGISANGTATFPLETDSAQEFSPMNKSGHPIVTGLDNYPNSTAVGGKKGLLLAAMKAPWNTNLGQQTMMCSDCHTTDNTNSIAAQGPHGSASQYMLRGPNAANWPTGTPSAFGNSWCANCHNNAAGQPHSRSDHSGQQCYRCHTVIPHGGRMSRLIADRDGAMPARFAYNNDANAVYMYSYTKNTTNGYSEANCRTSCGQHATGSSGTMENW